MPLVYLGEALPRPKNALITSLAFSYHGMRPTMLAVTSSDGGAALLEYDPADSFYRQIMQEFSHTTTEGMQAWTCAFTFDNSNILTGGDDSALQCAPISLIHDDSRETFQLNYEDTWGLYGDPNWRDTRTHEAGVTAILILDETLFLTGSYDERVRLLAKPLGAPRLIEFATTRIDGGGVWRLREMAKFGKREWLVLASCMHAGARILRVGKWDGAEQDRIEVLAAFTEHQSMNYGSDFQPLKVWGGRPPDRGAEWTIVSTSFYDKRVCLWRWKFQVPQSATAPAS